MEPEKLQREWEALAEPWIHEARHGRNPTREGLLDPPMLQACGCVEGLDVLDCGCGEGRFCRLMIRAGARSALGLDLCPAMIEAARQAQTDGDEYRLADVQAMAGIPDSAFDLAVSYLNQCDLPDIDANNREVFRVLCPGGRFIVANLHPMRSSTGLWQRDDTGSKLHVIVDRYFDEGPRQWTMMGVAFTNFHRSLATQLDSFFEAGFALERIVEPTLTAEQLARYPELDDELRVPNFIIYVLHR